MKPRRSEKTLRDSDHDEDSKNLGTEHDCTEVDEDVASVKPFPLQRIEARSGVSFRMEHKGSSIILTSLRLSKMIPNGPSLPLKNQL